MTQSELDHLLHRFETGELTAEQFNVQKVRMERVKLVTTKIPRDIRKQYSAAVKRGELGHMKKDGYKPEVYFHPSFKYLVAGKRNNYERQLKAATREICI